MTRLLPKVAIAIALAWLAWASWQMPPAPTSLREVRQPLPVANSDDADQAKWRVVTRKIVWKQAAQSLQQRLQKAGFMVTPVTRRETVELHAFDDPRTFTSLQKADATEAAWKKKGIDAQVIKYDNHYGVALGRFFLPEYAEARRQLLEKSGEKYSYAKRTVEIPVYRFTFPTAQKDTAEKLWKHLQDIGIADPALIREDRFNALYGTLPQEEKRNLSKPKHSAG